MKKILIGTIVLMQIFTVALYAQRGTTANQPAPRKISFAKLSEYVGDYNKHRNGERLLVVDVPAFSKVSFEKSYNMYFFQPDESGGVNNTFYGSPALGKSLRQNLQKETASRRITCMLIEFVGSFDVYRSLFAIKVEGLNENGAVIWTVTGPPPSKLKIKE